MFEILCKILRKLNKSSFSLEGLYDSDNADEMCFVANKILQDKTCNIEDMSNAVALYKKAAELGHVQAQYNFAICLHKGRGIRKNIKEAIIWYEKAAEQGHIWAQCNLGNLYLVVCKV